MKTVNIGKRPVGCGHPCFILAEAGCNHNGKLGLAKKLIDISVKAGADAVKFQTYHAENIYSRKTPMMKHFKKHMEFSDDATMYDLIKKTELPWDMHKPITEYCRKRKIVFMSTPFEPAAVDLLEKFNVPAYKIASFEMTDYPLIRRVAATGKPVLLSTGMSGLGDIEKVLRTINAESNDDIILLHCVSNYPARPEDYNLRVINTLRSAFGYPVGLSDHTPGVEVSKIAVSIGADLIEKHITVDQSLPGPDHHFSLLPQELKELCDFVKFSGAVLGSPFKTCVESENKMKYIGRRSLVAAGDIKAGRKITAGMIAVKRPGYGIHPEFLDKLIGAVAIRDIEADTPLSWEMFINYTD